MDGERKQQPRLAATLGTDGKGKLQALQDNLPQAQVICIDNRNNNGGQIVDIEEAKAVFDYDITDEQLDNLLTQIENYVERAEFDELDYDADNLTEEQAFARDAVIEVLQHNAKKAGLEIEFDADERGLEAQKKSLSEIATWSELMLRTNYAADISSNDNAKILQKIETTKQKVENQSSKSIKKPVSFISDVLGLQQSSSSYYGSYKTKQGNIVTLRLSNHNATVSNFDNVG